MARMHYPKVRARLADGSTFAVVGREAATLLLLVEKKTHGLRAYDFRGGPPFRLSAYIHDLRHNFGLAIETTREPHATGTHAVYTMATAVEIVAIDYGISTGRAAA